MQQETSWPALLMGSLFNPADVLAASETPGREARHLVSETFVRAPLDRTFAFFADAANLDALTPPWLRFRIVTPMPVRMQAGAEIDYQITLRGIRIPWRSRIEVWEPGRRFVDTQVFGPYRWWRHDHCFAPAAGGTWVVDHVEYVPRLRWLTAAMVRRDLERIFAYRQSALERILEVER